MPKTRGKRKGKAAKAQKPVAVSALTRRTWLLDQAILLARQSRHAESEP